MMHLKYVQLQMYGHVEHEHFKFLHSLKNRSLDSTVDNALACHLCSTGSKPGQGMWQDSGHLSRLGGFPRFPLPHLTT